MSEIKWCDFGGHAFSTNDPEAETYAATKVNPATQERERLDICGPCSRAGKMQIHKLEMPTEPVTIREIHE